MTRAPRCPRSVLENGDPATNCAHAAFYTWAPTDEAAASPAAARGAFCPLPEETHSNLDIPSGVHIPVGDVEQIVLDGPPWSSGGPWPSPDLTAAWF